MSFPVPKSGESILFSELDQLGQQWRANGHQVVFTNGCFDILHAGHIQLFCQARVLGDLLVVGLNSDASVRRLKGPSRPINSQWDRQVLLTALRWVDYVVVFDHPTPIECIQALKPQIHVKGGDYDKEQLPETPIVESYGGKVVIIPFLTGRSTTNILAQKN